MNNELTELIVILDASGSMGRRKQDVIGGFNQLIDDQRKLSGDCVVTVVQFSSRGEQKTIIDRKSVHDVAHLTDTSYRTSGWTALQDAIGSTVDAVGTRLADIPEDDRPGKVIVTILTDGEENNSIEYRAEQVREKVTRQREAYGWEFIFTGANQDAVFEGRKLGIDAKMSATFADTQAGYQKTFNSISLACSALRSGNKQAACSSMDRLKKGE